ncbi:hypothetical protein [Lacipirellula parvula]|uniref:Uncharacterized protein n=1 Tax=Lacipirellula parvula TaxID=2650471 RepID=A0A5K7X769_9BACT|nr:hypothetical protein [Lacipirellula parvula]BBO30571.1 hypothetical protein PLANPX_0183 [Lacipirellula parvula]
MNARWHPQRLLRFSMGTLLFAMLAACIGFGSYAAGRSAGERQRYDETFLVKTYPVADLASQEPDQAARQRLLDELSSHLQTTVAPESWDEDYANGRNGEVHVLANASLAIHQSGAAHDQIEVALNKFRDDHMSEQLAHAISLIESQAVSENAEPVVLLSFGSDPTLASAAVATCFDSFVPRLTNVWGTPRFVGSCDKRGFPSWSLGQSIAQWSQTNGDVYIAVQDAPGEGRVLLGGWRRRE